MIIIITRKLVKIIRIMYRKIIENCLNIGAIDEFLKIFQSNNVMIDITANLKKAVVAMGRQAMRTDASATIQTTNVLLILL